MSDDGRPQERLRLIWDLRSRQLANQLRMRLAQPPSPRAAIDRLRQDGGRGATGSAPVFILGGGWRTGSTLLQRMLNQTGDLLIWGEPYSEGAIVQRLVESLAFLDPQRGRFHGKVLPDDGQLPPPDVWTANLTPPLTHLVAAQRGMLDRLFAVPAHEHGCARWGIKEVVWGRDAVDLLATLYPDARFLLLVREPMAQWRSYRPKTRRPWFYRWPDRPVGSPASFGRLWDRLARDFIAADAEVPEATLVRYEDLKEPRELDRLSEFLGLSRPLRADAPKVGSSTNRAFFTEAIPAWEQATVHRLTASTAQRLGYA